VIRYGKEITQRLEEATNSTEWDCPLSTQKNEGERKEENECAGENAGGRASTRVIAKKRRRRRQRKSAYAPVNYCLACLMRFMRVRAVSITGLKELRTTLRQKSKSNNTWLSKWNGKSSWPYGNATFNYRLLLSLSPLSMAKPIITSCLLNGKEGQKETRSNEDDFPISVIYCLSFVWDLLDLSFSNLMRFHVSIFM